MKYIKMEKAANRPSVKNLDLFETTHFYALQFVPCMRLEPCAGCRAPYI
jgi:hypothetical protein